MALDELENDWPAISALLDEALALPVPARQAWLDACTDLTPARQPARDRACANDAVAM